MARTYVVTGSSSGIGAATADRLRSQGHVVIGVDLRDADVVVDLRTEEGRSRLVDDVASASDGRIDAIIANAGLANASVDTVAVNYFGAIATLEGLRPLLAGSAAPRASAACSMAAIIPVDDEIVARCLDGDESGALRRAGEVVVGPNGESVMYASSKKALALWIRRSAATQEWAGAGIPLNAPAPGVVRTPMIDQFTATPEAEASLMELVPMPLNGIAQPSAIAALYDFLTSEANTHLCGQIIFIDGGSDVVIRGESGW